MTIPTPGPQRVRWDYNPSSNTAVDRIKHVGAAPRARAVAERDRCASFPRRVVHRARTAREQRLER